MPGALDSIRFTVSKFCLFTRVVGNYWGMAESMPPREFLLSHWLTVEGTVQRCWEKSMMCSRLGSVYNKGYCTTYKRSGQIPYFCIHAHLNCIFRDVSLCLCVVSNQFKSIQSNIAHYFSLQNAATFTETHRASFYGAFAIKICVSLPGRVSIVFFLGKSFSGSPFIWPVQLWILGQPATLWVWVCIYVW